MNALIMLFLTIIVLGLIYLAWISSKPGKKWLNSL